MNPPFVPEGVKVLSIGELTREVKGLIEGAHPRGVFVSGEVSNLARPSSGHLYLTLVYPATRHALNGMTRGWVREDWARRHHAKWVEEIATEVEAP